ncbi:hypothetical protein DBV15_12763 [Temnothorax longispinosus]|uniref:Uncharacterized protein n=1 Tax=Temnothorax longispinosus TaxID=300112 RepID=A0A4S2KRV7_9HYME|nr:hypothetical protein DBV15_12763 [Temnothorax longispinosus]
MPILTFYHKRSGTCFQMSDRHFIMYHQNLKDHLKKYQKENYQIFIEINLMNVDKLDLYRRNERKLARTLMN